MITINVKKLSDTAQLPEYKSENAIGADICSNEKLIIKAGKFSLVKTGLAIDLPQTHEAQVRSRSGLAAKNGVFVLNSPGTIDPDYVGEVGVILANFGDKDFEINIGDRIAQLVISEKPLVHFKLVKEIKNTDRGTNGFGSTGK